MKPAGWVGLAIIISALCFGAKAFVTNLTPYLSFGDARRAQGQVQVMGALDKNSIHNGDHQLMFTIVSPDGDQMPIRYTQAAPATFSMATQVTAVGTYDGQNFQATSLSVKCPSKYQGTETQERSYGGGA